MSDFSTPGDGCRQYLIRFSGDLSTKAETTQQRFVRRLAGNIKEALDAADISHEVRRQRLRLLVAAESPLAEDVLTHIFGIQSISRVNRVPWETMTDIVTSAVTLFADHVRGKQFAVRARRGGNTIRIPFRSGDVERDLGARLLEVAAGVDLSHPEAVVQLEIHPGEAFLYTDVSPGPGGLPLGVEGRGLSLVSGGFDSAVASWLMLKRGVSLDYLFFNLGGDPHRRGVHKVMKIIADAWSYGSRPRLFEIDFVPVVDEIKEKVMPRYWQVLLKRQMLQAGELLAPRTKSTALVTGEAVGQVSSQTLRNLAAISRGLEIPIMRPLIAFNKEEIIEIARRIGTGELSAEVAEYCALLPRNPETHARDRIMSEEEAKLSPDLLPHLAASHQVLDLRELATETIAPTRWELENVPPGATVLDLRSPVAFHSWHYPEALSLEFADAVKAYRSFDSKQTYVLYCEIGLKSAQLAERMRGDGFRSFHIKQGVRTLHRRRAAAAGEA